MFQEHGPQELWMRVGIRDTARWIPLHTLSQRSLCKVLPAVHCITGCDITSKVGTKKAAMEAQLENYLVGFIESMQLSPQLAQSVEQYLVKVVGTRSTSGATDFLQLMNALFHHSKNASFHNLPPTTKGLYPHLLCALYATHCITDV
jgi:hypothetical protein